MGTAPQTTSERHFAAAEAILTDLEPIRASMEPADADREVGVALVHAVLALVARIDEVCEPYAVKVVAETGT